MGKEKQEKNDTVRFVISLLKLMCIQVFSVLALIFLVEFLFFDENDAREEAFTSAIIKVDEQELFREACERIEEGDDDYAQEISEIPRRGDYTVSDVYEFCENR